MKTAGLAVGLFLAAFLLHWIIWRITIPRRQSAALLVILLGTLPVGLAAVTYVPALRPLGPLSPWQCLHVAIFHVTMSLGYVVAYSALEERSPSMTLLTFVADAGTQGRTLHELKAVLASTNRWRTVCGPCFATIWSSRRRLAISLRRKAESGPKFSHAGCG